MENKEIKEINLSCDCGWDTGKEKKKIICKKRMISGTTEDLYIKSEVLIIIHSPIWIILLSCVSKF